MRAITKGAELQSLVQHRRNTHSHYGNYNARDKDRLREALVREQSGLCCYCMNEIEANSESMKIEHWKSQTRYPELQLSYSNLLGACLGGEGQPIDLQHCDTRKGERDLKFNPANPAHNIEQRIQFLPDGTILSTDEEFNAQLQGVLGLNLPIIKNRRKAVIDALVGWLYEYKGKHHRNPDSAALRQMRDRWSRGSGSSQPFVRVALYWLDRRLARLTP